jgi:hypothetical protein
LLIIEQLLDAIRFSSETTLACTPGARVPNVFAPNVFAPNVFAPNVFAIENFVDELAQAAGQCPVA